MTPNQLLRAVAVTTKGELVASRELLKCLLSEEEPANLATLSSRQREILGYVVKGLSNAEIGQRLFLSESTILISAQTPKARILAALCNPG